MASMVRKAQGPSEQTQRKRLARLHTARSDIELAREMCEAAMSMELDKADPVSWAFHHAVVVSYGRPFTKNRPLGALGAKWQRFADPRLEAIHRSVMIQRDEVIAHADLRWRPVVLVGPNTQLPSGVIAVKPMIMGARPIYEAVAYPAVNEVCLDLVPRLTQAFDEQFHELYPAGFNGPSVQLLPTEPAPDGDGLTISIRHHGPAPWS
jgi:hypothetical protein